MPSESKFTAKLPIQTWKLKNKAATQNYNKKISKLTERVLKHSIKAEQHKVERKT